MTDRGAVFRTCKAFDLSRGERCDIASVLFNRTVESYSDLSPIEWARLRDGFDVARHVCIIQMERRTQVVERNAAIITAVTHLPEGADHGDEVA